MEEINGFCKDFFRTTNLHWPNCPVCIQYVMSCMPKETIKLFRGKFFLDPETRDQKLPKTPET